ncbi:heavy metal translocating P-type ATPase [Oceanicella sp. SM1341]|uniref:heavy metal translocating P-type ATPase n=1 Tax=Oceanicella sp. SM1341 TaxID=1548889 RepID=UPI000E4B99EF|nr:heavy metal translocating P-type ATPase [Oceanicella sp. SM1341]
MSATDYESGPAPAGACCPTGAAMDLAGGSSAAARLARPDGKGRLALDLLVPEAHCAACIGTIERGLGRLPGVASARLNLSLHRLAVSFEPGRVSADDIIAALAKLGYSARPCDSAAMGEIASDARGRDLTARLGVAGFAAMNIMLLSVAIWSGADGATRDLLHWISAMIALPVVIFSGMPFHRSALRALRAGRLNMDVPISLAILLAAGVSLSETIQGGAEAYFDASVSLTFFLLLGRVLDHHTRRAARSAAAQLATLTARTALLVTPEGRAHVHVEDLRPGDRILVARGETLPADGVVLAGESEIDRAMVTGESLPEPARPGTPVHAGMMNLADALTVEVRATGEATLIAEITRMVAAAEAGRNRYTRLADRAARIYAPAVHIAAALVFAFWLATGLPLREAVMIAAAVLIVTCPCALGLAVPAVQAVVSGRLFRAAVYVKDGSALERLAEVDTVVFDKTGTLTTGRPEVTLPPGLTPDQAAAARLLAEASRHPFSRAIAGHAGLRDAAAGAALPEAAGLAEIPGQGVEARIGEARVRLGRAEWCGVHGGAGTEVWLTGLGAPRVFRFADNPKPDAAATVAGLQARGLRVLLLSGDAPEAVAHAAGATGIAEWQARLTPAEKLAALHALAAEGRRVAMVGDGLNDAPALAAAHVSLSPASGSDIARVAADFVFPEDRLAPVLLSHAQSRLARRRALENFGLAAVYNVIAVPLAALGLVNPLIAALAMSGSSVLVTLNALRPGRRDGPAS